MTAATATGEQLRAAWRRMCPGITDTEIDALAGLGMRGTPAQVALRAYRAGLATAERRVARADGGRRNAEMQRDIREGLLAVIRDRLGIDGGPGRELDGRTWEEYPTGDIALRCDLVPPRGGGT